MTLVQTAPSRSTASRFLDDLNGSVRENPVAAGLIGAGLLWMMFGGSKMNIRGGVANAARHLGDAVESGAGAARRAVDGGISATDSLAGTAARSLSAGAQAAGTQPRDIAAAGYDALKNSAGRVAETMGSGREALASAVSTSKTAGQEFASTMQGNLTATLERQPLVLGAIGLAIGAGIASAFPATETENKLLGDTGVAFKDNVRELAAGAADAARTVARDTLDEVKNEAAKQGLTPGAVKSRLQDVGDKLRSVAGASRDAIKDRLS